MHQIEAEIKPFNLTYLDLFLLQDEASIRRVIQGTHKQKSSSKSQKSSNNGHKTMSTLSYETYKYLSINKIISTNTDLKSPSQGL